MPVRSVRLQDGSEAPLVVYGDAAWKDVPLNRIGWLVFDPRDQTCSGYTMNLTGETTDAWYLAKRKLHLPRLSALLRHNGTVRTASNRDIF